MKIKWFTLRMVMKMFSIFPIKKNKIIFSSYHGTSYSCNPKYISEALLKQNSNLDVVWVLPANAQAPTGTRTIRERTLKGMYEFATAKVWVDNCRKSIWMIKRKNQFYIQTWHAGIGLKAAEGDAIKNLPDEYIRAAKNDSKMADLLLSNGKWLTNVYRRSFWFTGEIMEKGLPREDILNSDRKVYHKNICKFYGVPEKTKFLLYAPTFRNSGDVSVYDVDYYRILDLLQKSGEYWKILVRLHPNIQSEQNNLHYDEDILNGSKYPEINDLILASDIFISDYSSCMFDAMIAGCKVFLYASDVHLYNEERGYLFSWKELPFELTTNNDELERAINNFDKQQYEEKVKKFCDMCGLVRTKDASIQVAQRILEEINT